MSARIAAFCFAVALATSTAWLAGPGNLLWVAAGWAAAAAIAAAAAHLFEG